VILGSIPSSYSCESQGRILHTSTVCFQKLFFFTYYHKQDQDMFRNDVNVPVLVIIPAAPLFTTRTTARS
jgi:hypothetical protein